MKTIVSFAMVVASAFSLTFASDGDFFVRAEVQKSTVPPPPPLPMVYDDGTPAWFTWSSSYRSVWFDLNDFVMEPPINYYLTCIEMWFYHDSSYPWDTSSFSCEIWTGDHICPWELFESQNCTAQHYSPVIFMPENLFYVDSYFWTVLDFTQSVGGWPSLICDETPCSSISHSYVSDDFIVWEPWTAEQSSSYSLDLPILSWGTLKALF